jgi:hypothetical protein
VWWVGFDHFVTAKEQARRDPTPFAHRIRAVAPAPAPIVLFRVESHVLAFHLGRPVHTLVEWADLKARLREPGPHYVVTRTEFLDDVRQHAGPPEVIARSEDGAAARPHRPLVLLRFHTAAWPTTSKD